MVQFLPSRSPLWAGLSDGHLHRGAGFFLTRLMATPGDCGETLGSWRPRGWRCSWQLEGSFRSLSVRGLLTAPLAIVALVAGVCGRRVRSASAPSSSVHGLPNKPRGGRAPALEKAPELPEHSPRLHPSGAVTSFSPSRPVLAGLPGWPVTRSLHSPACSHFPAHLGG